MKNHIFPLEKLKSAQILLKSAAYLEELNHFTHFLKIVNPRREERDLYGNILTLHYTTLEVAREGYSAGQCQEMSDSAFWEKRFHVNSITTSHQ